jgi:hypothetical protein
MRHLLRLVPVLVVIALALALAVARSPAAYAMNGNVPDNRPATAQGEITAYYWHGVNRDPDPGGLAQYMSFANQNCLWGVQSAGFQILNSAEAHNVWQNNPQTLAGMLYAALLNRPPDPGGLATYTSAIQQRGLAWAIASMMASDEYHTRLATICPHPNDNAAMWPWNTAKSFAFNTLLHNAGTQAFLCAGSKAVQKIDGIGDDSDVPVVEILSQALSVENWIVDNFHLDGSCGAMVAYVKAFAAVFATINGTQYNPVLIEYTVGNPSLLTGQRAFTIRIGPDPTHWTGFSGKGW